MYTLKEHVAFSENYSICLLPSATDQLAHARGRAAYAAVLEVLSGKRSTASRVRLRFAVQAAKPRPEVVPLLPELVYPAPRLERA